MKDVDKKSAIQGLRFLFAVGIVFFHLHYPNGETMLPYGYIAVTFFFILSGYLSASSNTSDIQNYYKKKFLRIYPIHWFALICMAIAYIPTRSYWNADTWWIAGLNFALLQSYYPDANVCLSFNTPTWFLGTLVLFYLMLPCAQNILKCSRIKFYLLTVCMLILNVMFAYTTQDASWGFKEWATVDFPLVRLSECLLGMCLYDLSKVLKLKLGTWCEIGTLVFFILTLYTVQYAPKICLQIYWWLPVLSLIVYVGANSKGLLCKLLSSKVLVGGGKISMEIFMFHCIAIRLIPSIEYFIGDLSFIIDVFLVWIITFGMAIIWHDWINPYVYKIAKLNE